MSHTSRIKAVKIQSISALSAAIDELRSQGLRIELARDTKPRAYYSNQEGMGVAPFCIKLHDAKYDVGVYPTEGGYELRTDFFGNTVQQQVGAPASSPATQEQAKLGKIYQMYALHAATEKARNQGLQVERRAGENGAVQLLIQGY